MSLLSLLSSYSLINFIDESMKWNKIRTRGRGTGSEKVVTIFKAITTVLVKYTLLTFFCETTVCPNSCCRQPFLKSSKTSICCFFVHLFHYQSLPCTRMFNVYNLVEVWRQTPRNREAYGIWGSSLQDSYIYKFL